MSSVPESESPDAAQGLAQEESRRLRVLFDHLPALISYWDRDLRNVVANEAYVDWFGVHPEEMRGRHLRDIVGEQVYAQNEPHVLRALAGEGQQQFVRTLVAADGSTQYSQVTYTPDEVDGEVVGLFVLVADVTERVEAERELEQVNRLNADVLGLVGHDVRQPLSLVLAHLEMLAEGWEAPDQERLQRVDKALGAARRLSTLLDDILAMANVESGTIATRPLTVSLRDVVVEALTDVHGGSTVQVTAEGDPHGHADPFHLRQIVTNLVSNALRYGAPPVEVVISASDGEGVVTVHDRGSGVPAEVVPDMFERFRGAGAAATLGRHGSGFGLYIVSRLAEANGCRVGHTAREPHGSSFWVRVPGPA